MEDAEFIHEMILIMNDNQYRGGNESNKRTVIRLDNLMDNLTTQTHSKTTNNRKGKVKK